MKPEWVAGMSRGVWYRLSGDRPDLDLPPTRTGTRYLADNDPANDALLNPARSLRERIRRRLGRVPLAPWRGRMGFQAITEAWNGAVLATRFGETGSMIVFGGGHNDYFGSDVHSFDLATRQWQRLTDGYVAGKDSDYGQGAVYEDCIYPDGSPLPPHTYGYVQYDPAGNDFLLFKGQIELGDAVRSAAVPHMFNFDTLSWRRGPRHPAAVFNSGGWTGWDPGRRTLWGNSGDDGGGNAFMGFRPDESNGDGTFGRWGEMYPNKLPGEANHNTMAVDPKRDLAAVLVHSRDAINALALNSPANPLITVSSSGVRPTMQPYAGFEYSPNLDAFVYYSALDGANLYSIRAPYSEDRRAVVQGTWHWRCESSSANRLNPIDDARESTHWPCSVAHTFGRFRIASYANTDVAILIRHVDTPVYALRLT